MDLIFATKKLAKQLNRDREMRKAFGEQRSKRLRVVLATLRAAPNLGVLAPPYSPPHRCHELTANRRGTLSVDLDGPYRLLIRPAHDPLPTRKEGGLDCCVVVAIKICGIENTHD